MPGTRPGMTSEPLRPMRCLGGGRPGPPKENPRGGCRRAQERSSHFANYSIAVGVSSEKFFTDAAPVGAAESARDGSSAGCRAPMISIS